MFQTLIELEDDAVMRVLTLVMAKSLAVGSGLIDQALRATDPVAKRALTDRIQVLAVDKAFIVPLFAPSWFLAAKKTVRGLGFEAGLDSPSSAYDVWLAKE